MLLHELGGLHDGDRVDHGVLEARHVDAVAALLLGFLEVVEAVVGLLPYLVLDHLAVLVEADFKGERLEFLARLDDRVAHLLELDGFVRGFGRRQDARVHGVDVAFKDDLRELPLVGDGVGTGAVGARNAHADVVDGLAVNGLNAGALEEAVGTGHDVFRRKAPLLDEAAGDFGLAAHFKARRGGDAGKLEQRVEAPLLGLLARGLLQQGLHGRVGVHEFGVLRDRVGDDRNGGGGRKDGRADARGQKAGNKFHLDSPHFGCGWSGGGASLWSAPCVSAASRRKSLEKVSVASNCRLRLWKVSHISENHCVERRMTGMKNAVAFGATAFGGVRVSVRGQCCVSSCSSASAASAAAMSAWIGFGRPVHQQ